ncbi:peroxiredoxin family protein [Thalassomonas haliotis]|uniref:Redoxin domain-containing protein n=1 Tax=Thalassomonas haliotis TaxID=485448 RepID=A0ABY7VAX9_9GAMM|nr:redoxin domain-containing protein [Thalassomonas haliotis]WDE10802.1 redoxin domain-containing protein [Thalassomonas haliotis]
MMFFKMVLPAFTFSLAAAVSAGELEVGSQAPVLLSESIKGEPISSDRILRHKALYLLFFDPYRPRGISRSLALYQQYKQQVEFIALAPAMNSTFATVSKAAQALGINYPVIFDDNHQVSRLFNAWHQPTQILIGKDGKVKFYSQSSAADIQQAMAELSAAKQKSVQTVSPEKSE